MTRNANWISGLSWNRTGIGTFGKSHVFRYTIGTIESQSSLEKSRRRDSHPHRPTYEVGAFLNRATSASSRSGGNRTHSMSCSQNRRLTFCPHFDDQSELRPGLEPGTPNYR